MHMVAALQQVCGQVGQPGGVRPSISLLAPGSK